MSEDCKGTPGRVVPVVDRSRCEANEDSGAVCPNHLFEVRALAPEDWSDLSILSRLKAWAHGNRQAYVVRPGDCHACRRCIEACPEEAIRLVPART